MYNSDLICVSETHFNTEVLDAEVDIPGFSMFRCDRNFSVQNLTYGLNINSNKVSNGGGSIIYVKSDLKPTVIDWFTVPDSVAVQIVSNVGLINIVCVYRSASLTSSQNNTLIEMINKLCNHNIESVIVGDFNLPNVTWLSGTVDAPTGTTNKTLMLQQKFVECIHNNGLVWSITNEITRRRVFGDSVQESTLDQVLSTNEAIINDFNIVAPLGKSDHLCINVELNLNRSNITDNDSKVPRRLWGKVQPNELLELSCDIDWSFSSESLSSNEMWEELHGKLNSIADCIPVEKQSESMPWSNSALKRNRKCKDKMWAKFDENPTTENLNIALSKQQLYENCEISSKIKYEKKITANLKSNCKPFYGYLRSKRILKSCVTALSKPDGSLTNSNPETTEVLADAFGSVFVSEPLGPLPKECYNPQNGDEIDDITISFDDVKYELNKLDISKCQGPDSIHPKLLRSLSSNCTFVLAITKLFQSCATTCRIPNQWKTAYVTALYKKGSRKDALNYRPVSLTCILCKVYEKLIRRHILNHVKKYINVDQHGFVEGKSCLSNLLETVETILGLLEEGGPVDVLYFDFCKAFDSVPHYRLLTKMQNMGISGKTLDIVADFLSGRTLQTSVGGSLSFPRWVISGVPQGSVLGPLLFVIFINDLPNYLNVITKLFADDLKTIINPNNEESVKDMLNKLEKWENIWMLKFNPNKCKVMHLQYNENPCKEYVFNNVVLDSVESEKDLGVLTCSSLKWNEQVKACISKANKMVAWVTRNLILRDRNVMLNVYKTVIRPHLEYCVQLWSPPAQHGNWAMIIELENVQRRFTRLINGIGTLPYSERLEALNLTTLAERRIRGDLIETFKIVNGLVSYGSNIFKLSRSGSKLISNPSSSRDRQVRKLVDSFLSERVIGYWNKLPYSVRDSPNIESFKVNLEKYKKESVLLDTGNFWDVSVNVINKIEGPSYLKNKALQNAYLVDNPEVARRRGINLFTV